MQMRMAMTTEAEHPSTDSANSNTAIPEHDAAATPKRPPRQLIDREGFRPNVGIVLLNQVNHVFWAKRIGENSWQFPQGGIQHGENPLQAMYRELHEEIGLQAEDVAILGRTKDWIRYWVPANFIRRRARNYYKGQKQIWFLLRLVSNEERIRLDASTHPEFDSWQWHNYWLPIQEVIEFKRPAYQSALAELAKILGPEIGQPQGSE